MKAVYHPYTEWEDFQNHMYDEEKEGRTERVKQAIELLTDTKMLYKQMRKVTKEWKIACEHWFTVNQSHRAFLGQTACCIYKGIHEDETREAWGLITEIQRYEANRVADRVYKAWERDYLKDSQLLLPFEEGLNEERT